MEIVRLLANLIRYFWPFVKDQIFEGQSFRRWISQHKGTVTLWGACVMLLFVAFTMFQQIQAQYQAYTKLKVRYTALLDVQKEHDATLQRCRSIQDHLRKESDELQTKVDELGEQVDTYRVWVAHCGLENQVDKNQCPVSRSTPPLSRPVNRSVRTNRPRNRQTPLSTDYELSVKTEPELIEQDMREKKVRRWSWRALMYRNKETQEEPK